MTVPIPLSPSDELLVELYELAWRHSGSGDTYREAARALLASASIPEPDPLQKALGTELLAYGNVRSLEDARNWADQAQREGLRGSYPSACVVLDMAYARLRAAITGGVPHE